MKRIVSVLFVLALFVSIPLSAESVDGILMDKMCSGMVAEKGFEAAKGHTRECALMDDCKASGFGVVTADGKFLKFDSAGDEKALKALEKSNKKDNITVTVDGQVDGESIQVKSLKLT